LEKRQSLYFAGRRLPREQQIRSFLEAAAEALGDELIAHVQLDDWVKILRIVSDRASASIKKGKKFFLALDEFQWIAESAPEIVSAIQQIWDQKWQHSGNIVLILCGSYMGFMEREVLGQKSPLFGRRTRVIQLRPLGAAQARLLHPGMGIEDAARTYFICGGVPAYERVFSDKKSVAQNIAEAFFGSGPLANEPAFLLREELRELPTYYGVLTGIAHGTLTRKQLAQLIGVSESNLSFYLDQLVSLGYVRRLYPLSSRRPAARAVRFALADPLLSFWFRFVEETERHAALAGASRAVAARIVPGLESYFGRCFEGLCREALAAMYVREGVSSSFEIGEYWSDGVQIDVVGMREDGVVDLGECKWGTVRSTRAVAEELEGKVRGFPNPTSATIVRRAFVRRRPRVNAGDGGIVWSSLEDLYAALES
jgi:AAA+ ATPase superfamily predicted ATPase